MTAINLQYADAQSTYVNVGIGYGMNAASQSSLDTEVKTSAAGIKHTGVHSSLGKGLNFGASFDRMFSKNLGV